MAAVHRIPNERRSGARPITNASQKLDRLFRPKAIAPQSPWETISIHSSQAEWFSQEEGSDPPHAAKWLVSARAVSLRCERSHIDGEAVLHIGLEKSVVGFVHLLNGDDFDIGRDVMGPTKVEHLLGLADAADDRAGETATPHDKAKC